MLSLLMLMYFPPSLPLRCCGQHWGKDAPPGVCSQQEEGPGTAEPQPRRAPQWCPLLVPVRNGYCFDTYCIHHNGCTFNFIASLNIQQYPHCSNTCWRTIWETILFMQCFLNCRSKVQTLLYLLSSSVIMRSPSSPATLYECNWVMDLAGYIKQSCKYTCRLTCIHVAARYWSLMIEALSEQSALNIYCSIFENSPQVCTLAISSFLLYLGTAFFFVL